MLRPNPKKVLGKYLFYFLKSHPAKAAFFVKAQGVTRFGLSLGGIGSLRCPCPSLDIQRLIVDFLDNEIGKIDHMIFKTGGKDAAKFAAPGSLMSTLVEHRAALITEAVTGQISSETMSANIGNGLAAPVDVGTKREASA